MQYGRRYSEAEGGAALPSDPQYVHGLAEGEPAPGIDRPNHSWFGQLASPSEPRRDIIITDPY